MQTSWTEVVKLKQLMTLSLLLLNIDQLVQLLMTGNLSSSKSVAFGKLSELYFLNGEKVEHRLEEGTRPFSMLLDPRTWNADVTPIHFLKLRTIASSSALCCRVVHLETAPVAYLYI